MLVNPHGILPVCLLRHLRVKIRPLRLLFLLLLRLFRPALLLNPPGRIALLVVHALPHCAGLFLNLTEFTPLRVGKIRFFHAVPGAALRILCPGFRRGFLLP